MPKHHVVREYIIDITPHIHLILPLDGSELSIFHSDHFTPGEGAIGYSFDRRLRRYESSTGCDCQDKNLPLPEIKHSLAMFRDCIMVYSLCTHKTAVYVTFIGIIFMLHICLKALIEHAI